MHRREPATAPAAPHLRGRYLVRHRLLNAALRASDGALRAARRLGLRSAPSRIEAPPRRLLIAIGGHLGDAVLASGAIAAARRAFPDAELGVLVASWNVPVVEGHPEVARVHVHDHWRSNRSDRSLGRRWRRHVESFRAAARDIAAVRYDAAVDTYPYFENAAALLWRSGIPWRVGFESGGLGELYSRALPWRPVHVSALHRDIVAALVHDVGGRHPGLLEASPRYALPPVVPVRAADVARRLESLGARPGYIVVHAGAGAPGKSWSADAWRPLLRALGGTGCQVVLTGAGAGEAALVAQASAGIEGCIDTTGRFTWSEFVAVIAAAAVCIAPDTAAAHVAAATGTPAVVLWKGPNDPAQWSPHGSTVILHGPGSGEDRWDDEVAATRRTDEILVERVMQAVHSTMEGVR